MEKDQIRELNESCRGKHASEIIDLALAAFGDKIALASSLGAEDQVLTHIIARKDPPVRIFTLDTGRMFPESYELLERTSSHYGIGIEVFFPDHREVERMVNEKGINLFYEHVRRILYKWLRRRGGKTKWIWDTFILLIEQWRPLIKPFISKSFALS